MNEIFWKIYDWCVAKSDAVMNDFWKFIEEFKSRNNKPVITSIWFNSVGADKPTDLQLGTDIHEDVDGCRYIGINVLGYGRLHINNKATRTYGEQTIYCKVPVNTPIKISITNIYGTHVATRQQIVYQLRPKVHETSEGFIFLSEKKFPLMPENTVRKEWLSYGVSAIHSIVDERLYAQSTDTIVHNVIEKSVCIQLDAQKQISLLAKEDQENITTISKTIAMSDIQQIYQQTIYKIKKEEKL